MKKDLCEQLNKQLAYCNSIVFSKPNEVYKLAAEIYDTAKDNGLKEITGVALIMLCLACRSMAHIKEWLIYSYEAYQIFEELNIPRRKLHVLNLISIAYFYSSVYDKALEYGLRALDLSPKANDPYLLSCVLNNLGEIYMESKKLDEAIHYFNEALLLSQREGFAFNYSYIQKNIGQIYFYNKFFEKALEYFTLSYNGAVSDNDMVAACEAEIKLGNVYFELEDLSKAHAYYESACTKLENIDSKFYAIDALIGLGKIEIKTQKATAIPYLEKALGYALDIQSDKKLSLIYKLLTFYYEDIKNFEPALTYFKQYIYYKEKVDTLAISYKLEVIQFEVAKLKQNNKLTEFKQLNETLEKEKHTQEYRLKELQTINETLTKLAHYDQLTGLANRHLLMPSLENFWKDCLHDKTAILFVILDIDKFKNFNDYWGHQMGDKCLVDVANVLKNITSTFPYLVGRYGGEEFICCVKNINYNEAFLFGEKIRLAVEALHIHYTNSPDSPSITISLGGIIGYPSHLQTIANALEIADQQLYYSKELGRNKFTLLQS